MGLGWIFADMRKYDWSQLVFRQFKPLETSEAWTTLNAAPLYVYRLRPRFNSEYVWNKAELDVWGGNLSTYVYQPVWSLLP
jgi:hypothetical protein